MMRKVFKDQSQTPCGPQVVGHWTRPTVQVFLVCAVQMFDMGLKIWNQRAILPQTLLYVLRSELIASLYFEFHYVELR